MYTPSRSLAQFYIAGFKYWNGASCLTKLRPGKKLRLVLELDNPYDPQAVALYYKKHKLGYVPREENGLLSQMLRFGHSDVFETRVLSVAKDQPTYKQVYVSINITDATNHVS